MRDKRSGELGNDICSPVPTGVVLSAEQKLAFVIYFLILEQTRVASELGKHLNECLAQVLQAGLLNKWMLDWLTNKQTSFLNQKRVNVEDAFDDSFFFFARRRGNSSALPQDANNSR